MQGGRNANNLYPVDSQPSFWRNLFDYVMGNGKMQEPDADDQQPIHVPDADDQRRRYTLRDSKAACFIPRMQLACNSQKLVEPVLRGCLTGSCGLCYHVSM
jgi:hypothetical protein